jgi:hypothetical protein
MLQDRIVVSFPEDYPYDVVFFVFVVRGKLTLVELRFNMGN